MIGARSRPRRRPDRDLPADASRRRSITTGAVAIVVPLLALATPCDATITWTIDRDEWFADTGDVTSIFFTELEDIPALITDQYAHLGLTAPVSSTLVARPFNSPDMAGMSNNDPDAEARIDFSAPIEAIGLDIRGQIGAHFYLDGAFVDSSPLFAPAPPGGIGFIGLTTDFTFDSVILFDTIGSFAVDNLHFQTIPAPPALALLALAGAGTRRRRR